MMTTSELRKMWIVHDIDEKTVSINGYKGADENLTIPETIGEKIVVSIGERAFRPMSHKAQRQVYSNIKTISLSDTITRIEPEAFEGCKALVSVSLSSKLSYLGYSCFAECDSLEKIEIPETVQSIDNGVFSKCKSLKSCILHSDETTITHESFYGCEKLDEIYVLKNGKRKPFIWSDPTNGYLPDMGHYAFCGCKSLKEMVIHENTREISEGFLYDCESLEKIELPESLEFIGANAFRGCSSVTYLRIPPNVKHIDFWAFFGMKSLKRVDFCSKVAVVDESAFRGCPDFEMRFIDVETNECVLVKTHKSDDV